MKLRVLIDSGVDESFIDWYYELLPQPSEARVPDGTQTFKVTHKTEPSEVLIGEHHKLMSFHSYCSSQFPLMLGLPWLREQNPHIDSYTGKILNWSEYCRSDCLNSLATI